MGLPPLNSPPPREPPPLSSRKTSWSALSLGATAASRGPSPVPGPTPTPIGKMCVFQVSKYCHLPESSMASPFRGGVYWPACPATGVHVAPRSNRTLGWVEGILQAQLESTAQTYLYGSSAFSQTGKPFPALISSTTKERLHVPGSHHTHSFDPFFTA